MVLLLIIKIPRINLHHTILSSALAICLRIENVEKLLFYIQKIVKKQPEFRYQ